MKVIIDKIKNDVKWMISQKEIKRAVVVAVLLFVAVLIFDATIDTSRVYNNNPFEIHFK